VIEPAVRREVAVMSAAVSVPLDDSEPADTVPAVEKAAAVTEAAEEMPLEPT